MYHTSRIGLDIEPRETLRSSENTVWYRSSTGQETSQQKKTVYSQWHATFEDARAFLIQREHNICERLEREVQRCRDNIDTLVAYQNPEGK